MAGAGAGKKKCRTTTGPRVSKKWCDQGAPWGKKESAHKKTQSRASPPCPQRSWRRSFGISPLFTNIVRSTPHPCAALMEECYRSDEWFDILERRELRQWGILEHRAALAWDRDHRDYVKRYRDPIEALAADRRNALQLIGVYEDIDDESLWRRKRARSGCW